MFLKKILTILFLYPILLFAQYFDKLHELPKDVTIGSTWIVKYLNKYELFYTKAPYGAKKYGHEPTLLYVQSSLLNENGDSITSPNYFPEDTTIQRIINVVHSTGKYLVGMGSYRKIIGNYTQYDERGWMVKIDTAYCPL